MTSQPWSAQAVVCSRLGAQGVISDYQGTMCDVPATLVDLAGATAPWPVDGTPIPLKTLVSFQPLEFNFSQSWRTAVQGMGQLARPRDQ